MPEPLVLLGMSNLLRNLKMAKVTIQIHKIGAGVWLYPDISPRF